MTQRARQRRWNRGNFPPDFFPGRRGRVADAETALARSRRRCRKIDQRVSRRETPPSVIARAFLAPRFPSRSFRWPSTILFSLASRRSAFGVTSCTENHKAAWWPIPARLSCVMCFMGWRVCECGRERAAKNRGMTSWLSRARGTIASKAAAGWKESVPEK